ncbi:hypothetical protein SAMN05444380_11576 [Thermophagus xiamenensis]|uniref:Uncharacterized protein n=1 Tax=Thermophagus xiamenensis TaxID=385682 RepID=A0A1I2CA70_9BACT|nr:hypothetical protein SAMN05444380_11576 [Thermophagus xiamenensis]
MVRLKHNTKIETEIGDEKFQFHYGSIEAW